SDVGTGVSVISEVGVGVSVASEVGVGVSVASEVGVGVEAVCVPVAVGMLVGVRVAVRVLVRVAVGTWLVGVRVAVAGAGVNVGVAGAGVNVGVGEPLPPNIVASASILSLTDIPYGSLGVKLVRVPVRRHGHPSESMTHEVQLIWRVPLFISSIR